MSKEFWVPIDPHRKVKTRDRERHSMVTMRAGKKASTHSMMIRYCSACGLMELKNQATQKALRGRCDAKDEAP